MQRFKLRARVIGKGLFVCPYCGRTMPLILTPTARWLVRCTYKNCEASFRIGLVFYHQPPAQGGRPGDIFIEPIPEAKLSSRSYRRAMNVHQLVEGEEEAAWPPPLDAR